MNEFDNASATCLGHLDRQKHWEGVSRYVKTFVAAVFFLFFGLQKLASLNVCCCFLIVKSTVVSALNVTQHSEANSNSQRDRRFTLREPSWHVSHSLCCPRDSCKHCQILNHVEVNLSSCHPIFSSGLLLLARIWRLGFCFLFFSTSPCIGLDLCWCELLPTISKKKVSDYLVAFDI